MQTTASKNNWVHALILISTQFIVSCGKNDKLQVYSCKNGNIVYTDLCSKECEIQIGMNYKFIANKEEGNIFQVVYYKGNQMGAYTLKGCVFINENNWDCSKKDSRIPGLFEVDTVKMVEGRFSEHREVIEITTGKNRNSNGEGICAK